MTESTVAPKRTRDINEMRERKDLFKQVALTLLSSRTALAMTADANGPKVSDSFVETATTITEGILEASTKFGEK